MFSNNDYLNTKAIIIAAILKVTNKEQIKTEINELNDLAQNLGAQVMKIFVQKINHQHPRTFIGKGKIDEIKQFIILKHITIAIFNDNLSPSQVKNIEQIFKSKVVDRTQVILDLFSQRAKTSYAKTQIKLAQYKYALSKLPKLWPHLEKQRGVIGCRGPGESEIETDRRNIRTSINKLKQQIKLIDQQMETQRKHRQNILRISIVGYTNVGKSTLLNVLSHANVYVEHQLFSTVDTTVRKINILNQRCLLSDTVGFLTNLPHQLITSFKSTLYEIQESDFLIHLIDINNPYLLNDITCVENIVLERGINKPVLKVFNQIDICHQLNTNKYLLYQKYGNNILFVSAIKTHNIELLKTNMFYIIASI
ncbi:GTPase HflX [Candidatus Karelsulcia muelleri]